MREIMSKARLKDYTIAYLTPCLVISPLNNKVAEKGAAAGGNLSQVPPLEKGKFTTTAPGWSHYQTRHIQCSKPRTLC